MLEYDKVDVSEGIGVNKTNTSKECGICHYWYFLDKGLNNELYLCNGCPDLMQKVMNFDDVTIFSVKGSSFFVHDQR